MVIKIAKKIECLSVSYNYAVTICKPCLEISSNDSNKIYQLFGRIPYSSYFRKYRKKWYQWLQVRDLFWGSTWANLDAVSEQLFQKSSTTVLFWVRRIFSEMTKNCSWWIVQKILSKKVKQVHREGVERQELQWNCKRNQSELLRKLYCRHFYDILKYFCLNGVFMNICQLLCLLRSRKVVGYKVQISISNLWSLKVGEVLPNEGWWNN